MKSVHYHENNIYDSFKWFKTEKRCLLHVMQIYINLEPGN